MDEMGFVVPLKSIGVYCDGGTIRRAKCLKEVTYGYQTLSLILSNPHHQHGNYKQQTACNRHDEASEPVDERSGSQWCGAAAVRTKTAQTLALFLFLVCQFNFSLVHEVLWKEGFEEIADGVVRNYSSLAFNSQIVT